MIPLPMLLAGNGSTLFTGCSKTGIPGAGVLGVVLLANLMPDTRQSVGVLLPLLIAADLFAISYYRRHADWRLIFRLLPWTLAGLALGYFTLRHNEEFDFSVLLGVMVLLILALDTLRIRLGWSNIPHHQLPQSSPVRAHRHDHPALAATQPAFPARHRHRRTARTFPVHPHPPKTFPAHRATPRRRRGPAADFLISYSFSRRECLGPD